MSETPTDTGTETVQPEATGDPVIDEALARLDALDGREVGDHPAEFEHVHRVMRDALAGARRDEGPRTGA